MSQRVQMVAIAAQPVLRGGYAAVVTDDETGESYIRLVRNGDPTPEPGPAEVETYREQRRAGLHP